MNRKKYYLFGLNIASAIPLPAESVTEHPAEYAPDVVIEYGNTPDQLTNPQSKGVRYQTSPGEFLLHVDSVARYYVSGGCRIVITPEPGADEERILIFLMGSAIGALLHQRNILALHAGAIEVNGRGILFAGDSGVGKTTLTAGFHMRGYPFLADEVCAISMTGGKPAIIQGFPNMIIWADSLRKLDKTDDKNQLKRIRCKHGPDKYFLPVEPMHKKPVVIQSVFVLAATNAAKVVEIIALKGGAKIQAIVSSTYHLGFLNGLGGRKEHFRQCAAVAIQTKVYKVVRPERGFSLPELMNMLETNFS